MPRDLPVGNGNMLVAFDSHYQLREFYFPYVGQANHTLGHPFRFGVWADGALSWVDEPGWERTLCYEPGTLVTEVRLVHAERGMALTCRERVGFDANIFLRKLEIENLRDAPRVVRTMQAISENLWCGTHVGGLTRYQGDPC